MEFPVERAKTAPKTTPRDFGFGETAHAAVGRQSRDALGDMIVAGVQAGGPRDQLFRSMNGAKLKVKSKPLLFKPNSLAVGLECTRMSFLQFGANASEQRASSPASSKPRAKSHAADRRASLT
jgi:hypothetical protein